MKRKAKILITAIIFIAIVSLILYQQNQALELDTLVMEKQDIIRSFKETAKLQSTNQYSISAPYSDTIEFIAKAGDKIQKGDLLLSLDNRELTAKKNELLAKTHALDGQEQMSIPELHSSQTKSLDIAIAMARDKVNSTKLDMEKYQRLLQEGAASEAEYEQYQRLYDNAVQTLKLKESEKQILIDHSQEKAGSNQFYQGQRQEILEVLKDIDYKLAQQNIYATSDGVITAVFAEKGDRANPAQPLMKIAGTEEMVGTSQIIASDAMALKIGQQVEIRLNIGQEELSFSGEIVEIGNNANTRISALGIEEQRVEVQVKAEEFKDLIVGTDMDIIFETMHLRDKLAVPKTAVFNDDHVDYVWLVKAGKLEQQAIEIGKDSDYEYELLSGLKAGDIIVKDCNNSELKLGKKIKSKN